MNHPEKYALLCKACHNALDIWNTEEMLTIIKEVRSNV